MKGKTKERVKVARNFTLVMNSMNEYANAKNDEVTGGKLYEESMKNHVISVLCNEMNNCLPVRFHVQMFLQSTGSYQQVGVVQCDKLTI